MHYACDSSETDFCLKVKQTTSVSAQDNDSVYQPPFQGNVPTQKRRHLTDLLLGLRMSPKNYQETISDFIQSTEYPALCLRVSVDFNTSAGKGHKPWEKSGQLSNSSDQTVNTQSPQTITYQKISSCRFAAEANVLIFDSFQHTAQTTRLEDWFQDKNKLLNSPSLASVLVSTIRTGKQ